MRQESVERDIGRLLQTLPILFQMLGGHRFQIAADVREGIHHALEIFGPDADHFHVIQRRTRCSAPAPAARSHSQQANLTEIPAAAQIIEHQLALRMILGDLHEADADQIETVGNVALTANHVTLAESDQLDPIAQRIDEFGGERSEQRNVLEVVFQRTPPIILIQTPLDVLVALHDVEHVAQHFVHGAIRRGADRSRARVETHAGHLAEQIAWAELGYRIVVRKIDGCVNRNRATIYFTLAAILFAAEQAAAQTLEESMRAPLRVNVGDGRREINLGSAFQNVECRGAVLAFAADDIAGAKAAFHHRVSVQLQECARHFLEVGKLQQILDLGRLAAKLGLHHEFVGERAGGAGDHALAAGDTRRFAHGRVEVKADVGLEQPFEVDLADTDSLLLGFFLQRLHRPADAAEALLDSLVQATGVNRTSISCASLRAKTRRGSALIRLE